MTSGGDVLDRGSARLQLTAGRHIVTNSLSRGHGEEVASAGASVGPLGRGLENDVLRDGIIGSPGPSGGDGHVGKARASTGGSLEKTPGLAVNISEGVPGDNGGIVANQHGTILVGRNFIVVSVSLQGEVEDDIVVVGISERLILPSENGEIVIGKVGPSRVSATNTTASLDIRRRVGDVSSEVRPVAEVGVGVRVQEEDQHVVGNELTELPGISSLQASSCRVRVGLHDGVHGVGGVAASDVVLGVTHTVGVAGARLQEGHTHVVVGVLREVDVDIRGDEGRVGVLALGKKGIDGRSNARGQGGDEASTEPLRVGGRAPCKDQVAGEGGEGAERKGAENVRAKLPNEQIVPRRFRGGETHGEKRGLRGKEKTKKSQRVSFLGWRFGDPMKTCN